MKNSDSRSSRNRYYSRKHRSKSRSPVRSKYKKSKKSKKSKKYARRSRSNSTSSSTSSCSVESRASRNSGKSHSTKKQSTLALSSENSSRAMTSALSISVPQDIQIVEAHVKKALDAIEEDTFQPQTFFSTRDREAPEKKPTTDKVIIDLDSETVKLPKSSDYPVDASVKEKIFHPNFIGDADLKAEKWMRKLHNYRQKYFRE